MLTQTQAGIKTNPITIAWHLVLWVVLLAPSYVLMGGKAGYYTMLLPLCMLVVLLAMPVYLNLRVLIPKFLQTEKYAVYAVLFLALLVVFGGLLTLSDRYVYEHVLHTNMPFSAGKHWAGNALRLLLYMMLFAGIQLGVDWFRQKRINKALEIERLSSEVKYLKAQINPHFLFNTLNNLYALTLTKSDLAPQMVLKLSEMMEYMVYHSNEAQVPVQKEIDYLRNYIELEKLRCEKPDRICFEVTGQAGAFQVAPLLLLPFVENGFKHSVYVQGATATLHIVLTVEAKQLRLQVRNSLPAAAKKTAVRQVGGFGLENVRKRLQYLYPNRHLLHIKEEKTDHVVDLKLTL